MTPRLSNRYGAPTEIVEAVKAHPYDKGEADFSATELIKPPQLVRLYRQHEHEITLDVRDEMWKLLGSGVHAVLEMAGRSLGREPEDRLFATVESSRGEVKIASGQPDLIHNGVITDYKVTSVYAIQDGGRDEWEQQVNTYAWLAEKNERPFGEARIVAILRDWIKSRAGTGIYPDAPWKVIPMKLWPFPEREAFVKARVDLHLAETPPGCTDEERWASGSWLWEPGVTTKDKRLKSKACNSYEQARERVLKYGGTISPRPPRFVRCEDWCPVSEFCPQWAAERPQHTTTRGRK